MMDDSITSEFKTAQKYIMEIREQLIHIESDRDTVDIEKHAKSLINKIINCEQNLRNTLLEIPISQRSAWRK
jgi:hypothetical protein